MAAPSSPRRSLLFPPEILLPILSFASSVYRSHDYTDLNERNADLARFARVSHAFQAATYSVFYGDLRLAWMGERVRKLRKSFSESPQLLPLVRRLEATAVDVNGWVEDELIYPTLVDYSDASHKFLKEYCKRNGIEEDSPEWRETMEDGFEDRNARYEWTKSRRRVLQDLWDNSGCGSWEGDENTDGALELLDIVSSAPAIRHLVLREFSDTLPATEVAKRGPYPLLESLESPTHSPFFDDDTLPSILASSAPNLHSLSGVFAGVRPWSPFQSFSPAITLPPSLSRLEIKDYDWTECTQDTDILLQAQPSLRSLTLVRPQGRGWASSPSLVKLLSSLENLIIRKVILYQYPEEIDSLSRAITPSSSLRHLELELPPAPATLFAALPASLQSITILPDTLRPESLRLEIPRVLELMKDAGTRPLRVEFLTDEFLKEEKDEGKEAREEWTDAYAAEGHTLYTRSLVEYM